MATEVGGMTDTELANKVVALGVGELASSFPISSDTLYRLMPYDSQGAEQFVRDWRVAGALMEKRLKMKPEGDLYTGWCTEKGYWVVNDDYSNESPILTGESLPRAIIEACVEALSNE